VTSLDDVFSALADPTRRAMFRRLVEDGPETATSLAADLPISRQAVVKHLQALGGAGLVTATRHGREVRYEAEPERLRSAVDWLVDTGERWDRRLDRLQRLLADG
jgi:DNA-binding transcriptional ArsR family regulator